MTAPEVGGEKTVPADPMLPVAEALADDRPVDWADQIDRAPDRTSRLVQLRAVETLTAAHRQVAAEAGPEKVGPSDALFTWGSLRAIEKLGEGSFGEVWRAWDPALQREVALKLRPPAPPEMEGSARRWFDEARRLARVHHPNVLAVHGVDVHDGRPGIWTDLIHGQSLEAWLAREGRMSAEEATAVGLELCRALAAVHEKGLV